MKSKVIRSIAVGVSILMTGVIVANTVIDNTIQTEAADTLEGIQKLINDVSQNNAANPDEKYTILELVPDMDDAEIGYLFDGYEPALLKEDSGELIGWREQLAKLTTETERADFISDLCDALPSGPVSINGEYAESTEPQEGYERIEIDASIKYGYFATDSSAAEKYNLTFVPVSGETAIANPNACYYGAAGTEIDDSNTDLIGDETPIYIKEDGKFIYQGTWGELQGEILVEETSLSEPSVPESDESTSSESTPSEPESSESEDGEPVSEETSAETTSGNENPVQRPAAPQTPRETAGTEDMMPSSPAPGVTTSTVAAEYYVVEFSRFTTDDVLYTVDTTNPFQPSSNGEYKFVEVTVIDGSQATGGQLYNFSAGTIYCKVVFTNNEWFKKYVLNMEPEEYSSFPVEVITLTYDEVNANTIQEFDFLYLNGYGSTDLSESKATELFSKAASRGLPCMVDGEIMFNEDGTVNDTNKGSNLFKLAAMLSQDSLSGVTTDQNVDTLLTTLAKGFGAGTFANDQVYVLKTNESLLTKFYDTTIYSGSGTVPAGFQTVLDVIELENLYRETQGKNALPTAISKATVIRHIMNYQNRRDIHVKEQLNVLEIQPAKTDAKLTLSQIQTWVHDVKEITTTVMTASEFVGKLETLNDKYDLIYIGASTDYMNVKDGVTVYNNSGLNGLIYHQTGDKRGDQGYNGNDITAKKKQALIDFLKGESPIIVSDELLNASTDGTSVYKVNESRVESNSQMFAFLNEINNYDNLYAVSEITEDSEHLKFYLNQPKVQLVNVSSNTTAVEGAGYNRLYRDGNGKYLLEYRFTIQNEGLVKAGTQYRCGLNLDLDGDGRFEEGIGDFTITANGGAVAADALVAGQEYVLTKELPDGYKGVIAWNVAVAQTANAQVYASVSGYTKLTDAMPERLEILQLSSNSDKALNLGANFANSESPFHKLAQEIKTDFEFNVTYCTMDEYRDRILGNAKKEIPANPDYLKQYNMLILGFYENELAIPDAALKKPIEEFIKAGKSVLFTANTTDFKESIMAQAPGVTYSYVNSIAGDTYYNLYDRNAGNTIGGDRGVVSPLISQVNSGIITTYPFTLGTNFQIGNTRGPKIRQDSGRDDITAWYCLGKKVNSSTGEETMYSLSPNDAANNYYLYSQGNAVYSGFNGIDDGTEEEIKLFINTLISAYYAGIKSPTVKVVENGEIGAPEMKVMYRYFDESAGGSGEFIQDSAVTEKIYFTVKDSNFAANNLTLATQFFYEKTGTAGTDAIIYEGMDKSVSALSGTVHDASTGAQISPISANVYHLTSGGIYYIEVNKDLLADCDDGENLYFAVQSSFDIGATHYTSDQVYAKLAVIKTYLFDLK